MNAISANTILRVFQIMKLLNVGQMDFAAPGKVVFRASMIGALVGVFVSFILLLACVALYLGLLGEGWNGIWVHLIFVWFAFWLFVLLYVCWFNFTATRRSSNWLMEVDPERLRIKFRSHLNDHYPEEDLVVIELTPEEIA